MTALPEHTPAAPAARPAGPRPGLRERKKARTRAAIREHAFRLFREQGYDATTAEQIAWVHTFSDGIVREQTFTALNIPAQYRLDQLKTNLVRLRSLSGNLGPYSGSET